MTGYYQQQQQRRAHEAGAEQPQARPYQDRYKRTAQGSMDKLYNSGPYLVALMSFVIVLLSLCALQAVDIIAGKFTDGYFTTPQYGWYYSLATTGIVLAATGAAMYAWREGWHPLLIGVIVVIALIPISIDVYFDMLSVDIIKFNQFIDPAVQFATYPAGKLPYELFRIMVGALSFIGEPLAAASVILFPVLKELFKGIVS